LQDLSGKTARTLWEIEELNPYTFTQPGEDWNLPEQGQVSY